MKNFNFFEKLWEHGRTLKRVGLVLVMCLIATSQVWAWSGIKLRGDWMGGFSYTSDTWTYGGEGNKYWDVYHPGGTKYWRLHLDYFNHDVGPNTANYVLNVGTTGYKVVNTGDKAFKTTANAGILRIQTSQTYDGGEDERPNVWITRPTVKFKYDFENDGGDWTMVDATDNQDGTYTYRGLYCGINYFNAGPNDADKVHLAGDTPIGSPSAGDRCEFKWQPGTGDPNTDYKYTTDESHNYGIFTITKLCTITYYANGGTGDAPDPQEVLYGADQTLRGNTGSLAKTDYVFVGWNTASDGSGKHYDVGATLEDVEADVDLYAEWVSGKWGIKGKGGDGALGSNFETFHVLRKISTNKYKGSVSLGAHQVYEFKITDNTTWYGKSDISKYFLGQTNSVTLSSSPSEANCIIATGNAGDYTFEFDDGTGGLIVTYPNGNNHPSTNFVYYSNPNSWGTIKAYIYDDPELTKWDNSPILGTPVTIGGDTYYYTALGDRNDVIFHNGSGNQTSDLDGADTEVGHYYNTSWAQFTVRITLNNQSATSAGTEYKDVKFNYDELTTSIICPTKTGYNFGGYYTETNGGGVQIINASGVWQASVSGYTDGDKKWIKDGGAATLYAKWTEKTYSVTAAVNPAGSGFVTPSSATTFGQVVGGDITASPNGGYDFYKWSVTSGSGTIDDDEEASTTFYPTATSTVTAQFCPETGSGKTVFKFDVSTTSGNVCSKTGTSTINESNFSTLEGGYVDAYVTGTSQLVYATGGYIRVSGSTNPYLILNLDCPLKEGDIIKWYSAASSSRNLYFRHTSISTSTGQITLQVPTSAASQMTRITDAFDGVSTIYITVSGQPLDIKSIEIIRPYSITLDANTNGGTVNGDETIEATADGFTYFPRAIKSGYRFKGWYTASSGGDLVAEPYLSTDGATLYAQFEEFPTSGKLFNMAVKTTGTEYTFSNADHDAWTSAILSTLTGGNVVLDADGTNLKIKNNSSNYDINYGSKTAVSVHLDLDFQLKAGDTIVFGTSGDAAEFAITKNSTRSETIKTSSRKYIVTAESGLVDETTLYLWRTSGSNQYLRSMYISRPAKYTITYAKGSADGASGSSFTGTKTHGADFTLSDVDDAFSRSGYTYDGWSTSEDGSTKNYNLGGTYIANADITLYPHWVADVATYSITYHCNDATSGCPSNQTEQTALPTPLATPSKTGHYFGGWYYDEGFEDEASAADELSANVDLYAKWTCITPSAPAAAKITATDGCSGSTGATFSADDSGKASYEAWYWQTSSSGTSTSYPVSSDYETETTAGSKTIYVRVKNTECDSWSTATSKAATVETAATISWDTAPADGIVGGSMTATVTTNYSDGVSFAVTSATPAGCVTINETSGAINYVAAGTATITATVTGDEGYCGSTNVTKTITVSNPTYSVTYKANNGTEESDVVEDAESTFDDNPSFTVPSTKAFAGWNTKADGSGTHYDVGDAVPSAITVYADWKYKVLYLTTASTSGDDLYDALKDDYVITVRKPKRAASFDYNDTIALIVLHESVKGDSAKNDVATKEVYQLRTANVPVLNTKSYTYGSGRWAWGTPNPGKQPKCIYVKNDTYANLTSHPIFADLTPDGSDSIQILSSISSDNKPIQPVGSFTSGKEGYTLALVPNNESGSGAAIHELSATQRGTGASGQYLLISVYEKDLKNLNANGVKLFQNAAKYLIAGSAWVPQYKITHSSAINGDYTIQVGVGSATGDDTMSAAGTTITLAATPSSGYELDSWTVTGDVSDDNITVTSNQFIMPAEAVTVAATFVESCSAPGVLSIVPNTGISGVGQYEYGETIELEASCASGTDESTTYAWYKGPSWNEAKEAGAIQAAATAAEDGNVYTKSAELDDSGSYWCEASNGTGCNTHNLLSTDISVGKAAFTPDLNYESLPIPVGSTRDPVLTGVPDGAGAATYTSSDTDVAEVDSETGVVTAKAAGTATIRVNIAESSNYISRYDTKLITVREAILYTVTFDPNGGEIDDSTDPVEMEQATEDAALTMPTPEHDTYTFDGWYIADTEIGDEGEYTPTKDVTAYAKWKVSCSGGGSGSGTVVIFDGTIHTSGTGTSDLPYTRNTEHTDGTTGLKYTLDDVKDNLGSPTLTNNTGNGKSYSKYIQWGGATGSDNYIEIKVPVGSTADLYIASGASGGSSAISVSATKGAADTYKELAYKSWSSSGTLDKQEVSELAAGTYYINGKSDKLYIAELKVTLTGSGSSGDCYRVNYHSNGADGGLTFDPLAYDEGDEATVVANGFTFEHETEFIGWNTAVDGSGTMYRAGDKLEIPDDDVDLYAQWMPINRFQATEDRYWNNEDNWSHGVLPSASHKVIIEKPCELRKVYLINPIAKVKTVVIDKYGENTGRLTIVGPAGLAVEEMIMTKNAEGDLVGTSTTDLNIDSSSDHENGALAVKGYTEAGGVDLKATVTPKTKARVFGWEIEGEYNGFYVNQFIGTPMLDAKGSDYYGSWLYRWDATAPEEGPDAGKGDWVYASGALAPFQGYTLLFDNHDETYLWLTGTLVYSDSKVFNLAYDERHENLAGTETMLANSYLAPIDVTTMTTTDFAGGDDDKMEATIYVFNSGTPNNWSENEEKGKGNIGELPGQFLCMSIHSAEYTGGITEISSMQAFSVYAKSTGATFNLDYERMVYNPLKNRDTGIAPMRAPSNKAATNDNAPDVMKIMVECEHGADKLFMLTREDFNAGFDNGWDARKMFGESFAPQLYAFTPDGSMSVNCVPDEEGAVLGFRKGSVDSVYSFSFTYNGEKMLYLNDLKEQTSTLISAENTYEFTADAEDAEARFIISATPINMPAVVTDVDNVSDGSKARKIMINDKLYIILNGKMYDATGKAVK